MRTRVKVCCIGSVAEAQIAIQCGADALGLVAAMPSGPGVIDDETVATIAAFVPPPVATVLLTCETSADRIATHVASTGVSTVHMVSPLAASEAKRLPALLPKTRRVQVIHVEDMQALDLIPVYAPYVHAFLLDSGRPAAALPLLGGTGQVHDWRISARFAALSPRPVFLAGGLTPENAGDAIRTVRPFCLDLCSSVRTEGRLDPLKLKSFMEAVSLADRELAETR